MAARSLGWLLMLAAAGGPQPEESPRDLYGDPLPAGAIARMGTARFRHAGMVIPVAFAPDGKTLASAGEDNRVCIWDRATGKLLKHWQLAKAQVRGLAYSPDSLLLAAGRDDYSISVWETSSGKERFHRAGLGGAIWSVAFAPDSRMLVSAGDERLLRLWDATTGKSIRTFEGHEKAVEAVAFSPDGKTIASAGRDETVRLWETATGKEIRLLEGHEGHVRAVAFAPDGQTVVSGGADWTVRVWETSTGKPLRSFKAAENGITSIAFLTNSKTVVVAAEDWTIRLWDADRGKEVRALHEPGGVPAAVAVSPDGKVAAAGSREGDIQFWEIATGNKIRAFPRHHGPVYALALSPDGKGLFSGGHDPALRLWERKTGRPLAAPAELGRDIFIAAISTDGRRFAGIDRSQAGIRVGDCATGQVLPVWRNHPFKATGTEFFVFSPDGNLLLLADRDGVRLWDVMSGKESRRLKDAGPCVAAAFSPDGKQLACLGNDAAIRLWNPATGELTRTLGKHDNGIHLAFSPDGLWLATASKEKGQPILLWMLENNRPPVAWKVSNQTVKTLAFTPDGRTLCAGTMEGSLRLWETASGEEIGALDGHWHMVQAVYCLPDNRTVYSGGFDTNILGWDLARLGRRGPPEKDMGKLWADLAEKAPQGRAAVWALVEQPKPALAWLKDRLKPVKDDANIAQLIADLNSKQFAARQRATQELERLADVARPALRQALANRPSLEMRRRLESLLARAPEKLSPEQLRDLRALHALEQIGTPEACRLLGTIAGGTSGFPMTEEAKKSLERLARQRSVP